MPYVEVESGVRLFVQDWGEGKPIVLVHGWPSSHRIFEYQAMAIAERGYRVVAYDQRGFGLSDKPWHGHDYDTWAADLGKVIAALDLQDVTLAGYSLGGAVAMHYAATSQDPRVTKLALLAAAGPCMTYRDDNPNGAPPELFDGIIQGVTTDRPAFFRDFVPSLFRTPVSPAFADWFTDLVLAASPRATVRGLEETRDRDLRDELAAIRIPTAILHGVHDQLAPFELAAREQQRLIPGATLLPFEKSGHGLFLDEREKLTDELAAFAGCTGRGGDRSVAAPSRSPGPHAARVTGEVATPRLLTGDDATQGEASRLGGRFGAAMPDGPGAVGSRAHSGAPLPATRCRQVANVALGRAGLVAAPRGRRCP